MNPGRKLLQIRLECVEIAPVDYFPVLDDTERSFAGRLDPAAGVCRSDRRSDTVVLACVPCGAGREDAGWLAVIIPCACILLFGPDNCALGNVADFLINGHPVAEIAGQDKTDYEKKMFHTVRSVKYTKKTAFICFITKSYPINVNRGSSHVHTDEQISFEV